MCVLPERAEEDLPKAFEALKKAGVPVAMITTRIQDPRDPTARKIFKTASSLGIRRYRRDGEMVKGGKDRTTPSNGLPSSRAASTNSRC